MWREIMGWKIFILCQVFLGGVMMRPLERGNREYMCAFQSNKKLWNPDCPISKNCIVPLLISCTNNKTSLMRKLDCNSFKRPSKKIIAIYWPNVWILTCIKHKCMIIKGITYISWVMVFCKRETERNLVFCSTKTHSVLGFL